MINEGHGGALQTVLKLVQGHSGLDSDGSSFAHWLVEIVRMPIDSKVLTQLLEPSGNQDYFLLYCMHYCTVVGIAF